MGYNFATEEAPSLVPSRGARHQCSGSEALVSVPGRDVVWLPSLAYASMKSCRADWRAANGKTIDVPAEVEVPSVIVLEMDDLDLLLEKDAGWTQYVGSFDPLVVETWGQ